MKQDITNMTLQEVIQLFSEYENYLNESDEDYENYPYQLTMDMTGCFWDDSGFVCKWDFSKTLLHEQEQSVIEQVDEVNKYLIDLN